MIYHYGLRCDYCGVVHEISLDVEGLIDIRIDNQSGILIPHLNEEEKNGECNKATKRVVKEATPSNTDDG